MADLADELLFLALARAAERQMGELNAQNLTDMTWAVVTANR